MPACNSTKMNYFSLNKQSFRSKTRILEYISDGIKKGVREFYFKAEGKIDFNKLIIEIAQLAADKCKGSKVIHIINEKTGTCWLRVK